jgi:hypothetical protein
VGGLPLYLPRDVFLTFGVFFAATFAVSPSGVMAAAALNFCFLVDISGPPAARSVIADLGVPVWATRSAGHCSCPL